MERLELIGRVAAAYLRDRINIDDADAGGTARFIIDSLSAEHTAAIIRAVLADAQLSHHVDMKLPRHFVGTFNLPEYVLTSERATYYRNAACEKAALLLANTGDDESQSLKELVPIGSPQLQSSPSLWVQVASTDLAIVPEHRSWWEKALIGLQELHLLSLDRFAAYVCQTHSLIQDNGYFILDALGAALPALQMPKNTAYFRNGLNEKVRNHASQWKRLYNSFYQKQACLLTKQSASGILINADELQANFDKIRDVIPEALHPVVLAFIDAPSGWNPAAAALAECEWEAVHVLFDGLKKENSYHLGKVTLEFYKEGDPELLNASEWDYLERLAQRKLSEPDEEDEQFYDSHRNDLKEDRKLKSTWDKFIYGRPKEAEDFLAGLAISLEALFNQQKAGTKTKKLTIRCDRRNKRDFKDLNVDAGMYFAVRYKGAQTLLGAKVHWDVGELFRFDELVEEWYSADIELNRSTSKNALLIKFALHLEVETIAGGQDRYSTQLIWKFNPETVLSEFVNDWQRLSKHPMVFCKANRETTSSKGAFQTVDLSNVKTFLPVYDRDRGSFVAVYRPINDISRKWLENCQEAKGRRFIDGDTATSLEAEFVAFREAYANAIRDFLKDGLAAPALLEQLRRYSMLLLAICRNAKGDRNRELLLRPLLQVGTVVVEGGSTMAVVAPWHPLRMAAMVIKARLVTNLVKLLLSSEDVVFGDDRLFFDDLEEELKHPFYPEVVLGWQQDKAELLSLTDSIGDYSLHEPPLIGPTSANDTNENPSEAANRVLELVERYLALHPHEQANLSVVLYNCDSARLPQAVVDKIAAANDDEDEVRCQIIVRHQNSKRLRQLYEKIMEVSDSDVDSYNASEATKDFMARLRIGIMADQAPVPDPRSGRPHDISFSQDVIARHAKVEWYSEQVRPVNIGELIPPRWSRRRPAAKDDMKSVVYLCCPVQSKEGWSYLTALTSFLKGDWDDDPARRLLPARQLDFQDPETAAIFRETHDLANWVVNYDELLDRRQLLNQSVRIIRYKQSTTQGRNVIISSKAPLGLLRSMVISRLRDLNLELSNEQYRDLAEKFIEDANDVSGDIVLRAAKRGRNASELLGIVLSRFLVQFELGSNRHFGWYFLDDYSDWLGQREEQIADILLLSPEQADDGTYRLAVVVSEAKYIDVSGLSEKRKESQKQLRDTVNRIQNALFGDPKRLDRDLWLARLSDLILDGVQLPSNSRVNLSEWRRAIREGECGIYLRGYSHVFVSTSNEGMDVSSFATVANSENAFQEIFSRNQLRDIVLKYRNNTNPMSLRLANANQDIWSVKQYRFPVGRVSLGADALVSVPTSVITPLQSVSPLIPTNGVISATIDSTNTNQHQAETVTPLVAEDLPSTLPGSSGNTTNNDTFSASSTADGWAYPGIAALIAASTRASEQSADDEQWLREIESRTKIALQQFQLQSKLVSSVLTPNAALLKFAGSANLTVDQVIKRRSEFLTTYGINLIAIRPEPGVVSLSVERPQRQVIYMQDLWARWSPDSKAGNKDILIGVREDDNELLFLSPGKPHAPHTLIAGTTGSGKSVLMQNIILGITVTNTPEQARIVLIDPKQGVDYFLFENLPHLKDGIIVEQDKALETLEGLVAEMERRYALFRGARVQTLDAYNDVVPSVDKLPRIWLIHDEFADWMMVEEYKQRVVAYVGRLGSKARAAGIFLIFAAQRPDGNVMPLQLRDNLGNRLILRVASEGTSEIVLGEKGAERLLGRGHLLAKLEGVSGLTLGQVPFIDETFGAEVVKIIQDE